MIKNHSGESAIQAIIQKVPVLTITVLGANHPGNQIHGCTADKPARLRPNFRIWKQFFQALTNGIHHGRQINFLMKRWDGEPAANIQNPHMKASGKGLIK